VEAGSVTVTGEAAAGHSQVSEEPEEPEPDEPELESEEPPDTTVAVDGALTVIVRVPVLVVVLVVVPSAFEPAPEPPPTAFVAEAAADCSPPPMVIVTKTVVLDVVWIVVVITFGPPFPFPLPPPIVIVATISVVTSLTEADVVVVATFWAAVSEAVRVEPTRPPVEATERMLEEIELASETGQIVVDRMIVSVTSTVERAPDGSLES